MANYPLRDKHFAAHPAMTEHAPSSLTPQLYIVATPIGNLADISLRALDTLKHVDFIVCEDTREIKKIFQHYNVKLHKPLLSYHAQSSNHKAEQIVNNLLTGHTAALVSDRGTPAISDPGFRLVRLAIAKNIVVTPIPGASAITTALQASGAATNAFVYMGYVPHKKGRQTFVSEALREMRTVIFFESPHRIIKCLQEFIAAGVGSRQVILGRELTKIHEQYLRGTAQEILDKLCEAEVKGEFVVILNAQ